MKAIFRVLKNDHIYFKQMLDQLENQLCESRLSEAPNWSLLDHIVNTLRHYPEQGHHDLEDDILALLKSRHWISTMIIESLQRDHDRLERLGAYAQAQLSPTNRAEKVERLTRALESIAIYCEAYRNHIRTEEEVVFPMVEKLVAENDYSPL